MKKNLFTKIHKKKLKIFICTSLICALFLSYSYPIISIIIKGKEDKGEIKFDDDTLRTSGEYDPSGLIAMWSGPIDSIPVGWKLCNGNDGTPNTTNRFIFSTGNIEELGKTGGNFSHQHSYSSVPLHDHGVTSVAQCSHNHLTLVPEGMIQVITGSGLSVIDSTVAYTSYTQPMHSHNIDYTGQDNCNTSIEENVIPPYYKLAFIKKETNDPMIPIGLIVMWAGNIENIPEGWLLCNGSNGTPDLREKYIQGVTQSEDPGAYGGRIFHNHTYTDIPRHTHTLSSEGANHRHSSYYVTTNVQQYSSDYVNVQTATIKNTYSSSVNHIHTMNQAGKDNCITQDSNHLAPYFKLAFIMNTEVIEALPSGSICTWGDSIENKPSGWQECNGLGSTPDMRNRFPRSVTTGEQPGLTGGALSHRHVYTDIPLHSHTIFSSSMNHHHTYIGEATPPNPWGKARGGSGNWIFWGQTTKAEYTGTASAPHSHNVNPTGNSICNTSYESNLPPYIKLLYIQKYLTICNSCPEDGATEIKLKPTLSVEVYAEEGSDLTVTFYNASDNKVIGIDTISGGEGIAAVNWSGRSAGTKYSWYVIVDDGKNIVNSSLYTFTTSSIPPYIPPARGGGGGDNGEGTEQFEIVPLIILVSVIGGGTVGTIGVLYFFKKKTK